MKKAYILLSICLLTDWLLYLTQGISLTGKWNDWLLFWTWLIATVAILIQNRKQLWAKIYGCTLTVLILMSLVPLGVPFLTAVVYALGAATHGKYDHTAENYRIELTAQSVIALPYIEITQMGFILEKRIGKLPMDLELGEMFYKFSEVQSIEITEGKDSLEVKFLLEEAEVIKNIENGMTSKFPF